MLLLCVSSTGTYDVQKLTVNNIIRFIADHPLNSNARGVLVVMTFIDDDVNLALSVYIVLDNMIASHLPSLPNIKRGRYITLAYDIGINGLLQLGNNFPAFRQMVYVNVTGILLLLL